MDGHSYRCLCFSLSATSLIFPRPFSPRLRAIPSSGGKPANDVIACFIIKLPRGSDWSLAYGAFYCFPASLPSEVFVVEFAARHLGRRRFASAANHAPEARKRSRWLRCNEQHPRRRPGFSACCSRSAHGEAENFQKQQRLCRFFRDPRLGPLFSPFR